MVFRCVVVALVAVVSGLPPTPPQLNWQSNFGSIIHYNIATFAHHQGCGRENWAKTSDPKLFGTGLDGHADTDSWGRAMKSANVTYAVYVAKHNCGFLTWPTKTTLPDGSPYNYTVQYSSCPTCNVVADFLATCAKYNIKPGFYYSIATNTFLNVEGGVVQPSQGLLPGQVKVTQQQFYDIALAQLEELWSQVPGQLFEVWFDGGLPQDPYFKSGITSILLKYQPQAAAFNGWPVLNSTAIRWIGTEAGQAPDPTWSTGSCGKGNQKCTDCQGGNGGSPTDPDWCPAEVDSTLQIGDTWFYVENLPLHSLSDLQAAYHASLGHNSNWILDIAPPPNSTVAAAHAQLYGELGTWIRNCYDHPVASAVMAPGSKSLQISLPGGSASIDRVRLREDQSNGQLIHAYTVSTQTLELGAAPLLASSGTSVGAGKIDIFSAPITAATVVVTVDSVPTGLVVDVFLCQK